MLVLVTSIICHFTLVAKFIHFSKMHFRCIFVLLYIVKHGKQGDVDRKTVQPRGWVKYDAYAWGLLLALGRRNPSVIYNRVIRRLTSPSKL